MLPITPDTKTKSPQQTTYGGPPSNNLILLTPKDSVILGSKNGIGNLNDLIAKNQRLRSFAQNPNGNSGGQMLFGEQVGASSAALNQIGRGLVKIATGAATTQLDSPLPGPADAPGALMISSGAKDIGLGALRLIVPSSSYQMPKEWRKDQRGDDCKCSHPVHRAVGPNEKAAIEFEGKFTANPSGIDGKYFYPTRLQSINFAHSRTNQHKPHMWRSTGVIPPGLPHTHLPLPFEGPAVFVRNSNLEGIKHVRMRERIK